MTTITKNIRNGWQAETRVDLDGVKVLTILTMKRSDKSLTTTATVQTRESLRGMSMLSFVMGTDYHQTVLKEDIRATEKSVAKQHETVLGHLSTIKDRIAEHYGEAVTA